MLKILKQLLLNNKKIIENFSYLTIFQVFTLLSPFIIYPYIIKTVGLELYGVIIFAQTIVTYFSLIINFGFGTSGPRDVSILRDNPKLLSEYVSSIFIIKIVLWILCFIIYIILISTIDFFKNNILLYVFTYFVTISDVLFPIWFFQGLEKMKYITYVNLFVRSFFIGAIFIFIKQSSDYIYIPLLNAIGALVSGIFAIFIVFKMEGVSFIIVSKKMLVRQLNDSFVLFVSTISIQLYINLNKIIVGTFLGMKEVAIYDLGEKITSLLKTPLMMFSQAVFPKISREKSISFINKSMFFIAGVVIILYLILFFTSDWIVLYFIGTKNFLAITVVRILGLSLIFMSFGMFLGGLRLIPFGFNKEYMFVMVANGAFYIIIVGFLWLFNSINIYSVTSTYVLVEAFGLALVYYFNYKLKLLR